MKKEKESWGSRKSTMNNWVVGELSKKGCMLGKVILVGIIVMVTSGLVWWYKEAMVVTTLNCTVQGMFVEKTSTSKHKGELHFRLSDAVPKVRVVLNFVSTIVVLVASQ